VTAEVLYLDEIRGAIATARPMTRDEVEFRVVQIRESLAFSLRGLAELRNAEAHMICGFGTWHEFCEWAFGDLGSLRLSGSPEALVERNALVHSIRATGATTRAIREYLGISAYAVQQALAEHDPAPDRIVGADGASRSSRGTRREALPAPEGKVFEQAAEYVRRAGGEGVGGVDAGAACRADRPGDGSAWNGAASLPGRGGGLVTVVEEPLYRRDGSRFVLYSPEAQHTPPIPVPQRLDEEGLLPAATDPVNPQRTILLGIRRCPHGSFPRYAAANCCRPRRG
jgi:hypothetical protein